MNLENDNKKSKMMITKEIMIIFFLPDFNIEKSNMTFELLKNEICSGNPTFCDQETIFFLLGTRNYIESEKIEGLKCLHTRDTKKVC